MARNTSSLTKLMDDKPAAQLGVKRLSKPKRETIVKSYRLSIKAVDKIETLRLEIGQRKGRVPKSVEVLEQLIADAQAKNVNL